jgi:hypothetical protein
MDQSAGSVSPVWWEWAGVGSVTRTCIQHPSPTMGFFCWEGLIAPSDDPMEGARGSYKESAFARDVDYTLDTAPHLLHIERDRISRGDVAVIGLYPRGAQHPPVARVLVAWGHRSKVRRVWAFVIPVQTRRFGGSGQDSWRSKP